MVTSTYGFLSVSGRSCTRQETRNPKDSISCRIARACSIAAAAACGSSSTLFSKSSINLFARPRTRSLISAPPISHLPNKKDFSARCYHGISYRATQRNGRGGGGGRTPPPSLSPPPRRKKKKEKKKRG